MRTIIPENARLLPPQAKRVFEGVIYDVYQWEQEMYDGSSQTFEMLKRPDTVSVIGIQDEKIIVLEQEQPSVSLFYDLPCGRHDIASETELEAAKRELLEETGITFKSWKLINVVQPHTKIDWFVYTFLATDFEKQVPQALDSGEKITIMWKSLGEIHELMEDQRAKFLKDSLFSDVYSIEELLDAPEFKGKNYNQLS